MKTKPFFVHYSRWTHISCIKISSGLSAESKLPKQYCKMLKRIERTKVKYFDVHQQYFRLAFFATRFTKKIIFWMLFGCFLWTAAMSDSLMKLTVVLRRSEEWRNQCCGKFFFDEAELFCTYNVFWSNFTSSNLSFKLSHFHHC